MSVKYLYYTESVATGGLLSAAHGVPFLDLMLAMFGGERIAVHPSGADYPTSAPEDYPTLAAAQAAYPSHTWIYLEPIADGYLDELELPVDDVVYVVGHDLTGYGGESLNGEVYKLRTLRPEPYHGHAIVMLSLAAADRWMRMRPWQ